VITASVNAKTDMQVETGGRIEEVGIEIEEDEAAKIVRHDETAIRLKTGEVAVEENVAAVTVASVAGGIRIKDQVRLLKRRSPHQTSRTHYRYLTASDA
jgi:hypothetical protein